jgi:hypothetical protein
MDVLEKARERHAELKAQIEAADAVRPELERLERFLKTAEELRREYLTGRRSVTFPPVHVTLQLPSAVTSNMIERILDEFGPQLQIKEIIIHLKRAGWRGSGDERRDYKNIFTNLTTKPHRFRNIGGAVFERVRAISE